ncbi:MAG: flagellar biosynthesis anti-sigma factor FlgM [Leptospiraceae bacterium]|nr:flagellar biosynthesis anti-sigma factor FlgM [Leptospiraceae bacterium]MDW7975331.1 flagellar biosynthesis anti-sigma factor FlgM [Leptospiraceae bacterium]
MNIDKVSGISPIYEPKKAGKTNSIEPVTAKKDTIQISEEARIQHLINIVKEQAKSVDTQKIQEVKERLKSGFYDTDEVLRKVAENLYDFSHTLLQDIRNQQNKKD